VLVMVDSRVMCTGRMSSWERMKFKCVGKSTVHERENRVCGESEVCVCDIRLASDVYRKSEFVRE